MDQVQGLNTKGTENVAELLTNGMREAWEKFMEEFNQVFVMDQLDPVVSLLKQLKSNSQNPTGKQPIKEEKEKEDDSSSENDNSESSTLEKRVFGNHLLAKSVFRCLPQADLLSCRLINSEWHEYATEILLKRDHKIWFIRRQNSIRYFQQDSEGEVSNWRTLDMLTELLRTCKKFPCNNFVFKGGNLGNDDAQRFFSFYGKFIKTMRISLRDFNIHRDIELGETGFDVSLTDSRTIGMILSQQLPNLESLSLDVRLWRDDDDERNWDGYKSLLFLPEKNIKLPHLKTLLYLDMNQVDSNAPTLRQLLKAATNLKQFGSSFDLRDLDLFIESDKVKTISDLDFSVNHLEELEKLADHELELSCLNTYCVRDLYKEPQLWKRASTLLSKLFESSQNSLTELINFFSLGFLPQLKIPVLKNVKKLHLQVISESEFNSRDLHEYSYSFLPRGATFSRNFPQLNSLEIHFTFKISNNDDDNAAASWWPKCFPTDEIIPTVKTLKIYDSDSCPDLWMKKLSCMFPNVKNLSVGYIADFSPFSQSIWKYYQNVTELLLQIDLTSPLNSSSHILDSSFTGIPLKSCTRLEKCSLSRLEQIGDNFMENPSILNLKDLMKLDIQFNVDLERFKSNKPLSSFTHLSGTCAFNPLKSLKSVNIRVYGLYYSKDVKLEIEEYLKQLGPYKVSIKK